MVPVYFANQIIDISFIASMSIEKELKLNIFYKNGIKLSHEFLTSRDLMITCTQIAHLMGTRGKDIIKFIRSNTSFDIDSTILKKLLTIE